MRVIFLARWLTSHVSRAFVEQYNSKHAKALRDVVAVDELGRLVAAKVPGKGQYRTWTLNHCLKLASAPPLL